MKNLICAAFVLFLTGGVADAQSPQWQPLWPSGAPSALGTADHDVPAVQFWPAKAEAVSETAVLVCPGGGYGGLAMGHEGIEIAEWLNARGLDAWVLRYRLGSKGYHHPIQKNDVLRAMRFVRHARERGGAKGPVGVWGFSAGGHLASTAATHFDSPDLNKDDVIDSVPSRPDFAVLCYPVITMTDDFTHGGSKRNLLGKDRLKNSELIELLSNQNAVSANTPPTFLFHTTADQAVPVENAVLFFSALQRHKVTSEMHIYQKGRHGVGLASADPVLSSWPERLADWMTTNGWMQKAM
ncbi:MAG: alpha/beta hydrolase [Fuerstiella sp.]